MAKGEIVTKNEVEHPNDVSERKITRNQKRKNDMMSNVNNSYMRKKRENLKLIFFNLL